MQDAAPGTEGPEPQGSRWYFGYGSTCNPVSLKRRGIVPSESWPATISGFRLEFQLGGMANIVPEEGAVTHGVLHRITEDMWEVLRRIEAVYGVITVLAAPYHPHHPGSGSGSGGSNSDSRGGGSSSAGGGAAPGIPAGPPAAAAAFAVPAASIERWRLEHPGWHGGLPSERYRRIIAEGLGHYGADPGWVARVAAQPCEPARTPADYLRVPAPADPSSLPVFTAEQLAAHRGRLAGGRRAIYALGAKVVEVDVGDKPEGPYVVYLRDEMAGTDAALGVCTNLYEPLLAPVEGPGDLRPEHVAWAEDSTCEWIQRQGYSVRQVGWMEGVPREARAGAVP